MANIIVVFPKEEDAEKIRSLLVRGGLSVHAVCMTGIQALSAADRLLSGIVVCGYKLPDMIYSELYEDLPPAFSMLLIASQRVLQSGVIPEIVTVSMPIRPMDLIDTVEMIAAQQERVRKKKRIEHQGRSEADQKLIKDAKILLMERNNMTEEEAHRYLQKTSMDSGTNMVETAQMLFSLAKA